jgi:outer membrane protein assembly factor BamA
VVVQTGTDQDGNPVFTSYPIGGEAIFLFNQDWSFPIWGSLRGELFFDAGNVYPTLDDFDPTDLRYDAGVGLRLDTPIGPIRVEYGWKLDRQPDESAGELIFAIGTLF